jgi:parallel beta helix pectate lyase-like protein
MEQHRGRARRGIRSLMIVAALAVGTAVAGGGSIAAAASPSPSATTSRPTVPVPDPIDATGATDASVALTSFLDTVPDGSTIAFKAGAIYRMDQGLKFSDRHDLTFEGNGATMRSNGDTHESSSLFALWGGNTRIVIRDFNLVGNSPTPGVYKPGSEGAHGVLIDGGSDVDVSGVNVSSVWGDGFYVGLWADTVSIHDSTVASNGRNGVSIISGRNVTVQRVTFTKSGYCTFDIESNKPTEGANNITFVDNMAGTWGNIFLAVNGVPGSVVDGVTVRNNHVTGSTLFSDITLPRRQNIVFENNTSSVPADGPVFRFAHIDGLTVTGNVQPLKSGALAFIVDSTAVTYDGTLGPEPLTTRSLILLVVGVVAVVAVVLILTAFVIRRRRHRPTRIGDE